MEITTVEVRIATAADDVEERLANNGISVNSSDLELGFDGTREQLVGLRFTGLNIPPDAVITSAYIQFTVDEVSTGAASLVIGGQDADDAQAFTNANSDVSSRPTTDASVAWAPPDWNTVGDSGVNQQTPDITAIIQEIVDRPGWTIDSALGLFISGSGRRTAESYNGSTTKAPLLHVEYTLPDAGAPTIDLDGDNSSGATGWNFVTAFVADGAAVAIADADTLITDSDGATLASATITITNPEASDVLTAGALPAGITVDAASTATTLILTGAATLADYETAIEAVTFDNTSPTPVLGDRAITVVVNDGTTDSPAATATITVLGVNGTPTAVDDGVDATSGVAVVIAATDLTGNDSDPDGDALTITAVTDPANGTAVLNPDGTVTYTSTPGYAGPDSFDYTVSDGNGGSDTATVTVDVVDVGTVQTVEARVASSSDDAEERLSNNGISISSSDLELAFDGTREQLVGLRFTGLNIPPDAVITNAYIQFTVDEVSTGASSLVIAGQDADDAQTFTSANSDVSSRPTTTASVAWVPPDWNAVGDSGLDQQTPDITAIIQEIVDRPGWTGDSALALVISGSGRRTAESYNGVPTKAPLLHVEYTLPDAGTPTIDLDGDNSSDATGVDFATAFVADAAAVAIADTDTLITDSDSPTLASATITITNPEASDVLTAGTLPAGITVDPSSTATTLILIGAATPADYETAIESVTFDNTSPTPALGDRSISVVVNDGTTDSSAATTTVTVLATNSAPVAVDDGVDANSDVALVIAATDLTGNDNDPDGDALTITAVTDPANGTAVLNPDGTVTYTSTPGYTGLDNFDYTVSDGNGGTDTATVTVDVTQAETTYTVDTRVAVSADDAEERLSNSSVSLSSSDIELGFDGAREQLVGLRFTGLNIPPDAVITNAYVQFTVDEVSIGTSDLLIGGQDADDALTFTTANSDVSSRPTTTASVAWAPPDWNTVGDSGVDQQTPDITAVIQEIVDRPGWTVDSALALVISGTGRRTAESYNGVATKAPLLHVEYTVPPAGAPRIDLDDDDSSGATGSDFAVEFVASGAAVAIADADTLITDSDSANLASATITITNPEVGDVLAAGSLPAGITVDPSSTATTLILTGAAMPADYETAIEAVTFENTSPTPVVGDRTIDVVVNDGADDSPTATTTVTVSSANSPPVAMADGLDAYAGIEMVIAASDLTGNDSDADGDALTITAVTDPANGTAVLNPDGTVTYTSAAGYAGIDSFDYTISDGNGGSDTATVTLDVIDVGSVQTIESRVATSSDDAEENISATTVSTTSSDIELGFDGSRAQLVGLRFNNLNIPTNAIILDAYIQFTTDEVSTGAAALTISGEDVDNAQTFSSAGGDISSRPTTSASVDWTPPDWSVIGEKGVDQQTPNIAAVIQEIVDRPGWIEDNSLSLLISGSGRRTAEAADTNVLVAPKLHIEYAFPADGTARIDLDGDDDSGMGGTGFANKFFVDGAAVTIADADSVITDSDSATLASATITITNPETGDVLTAGSLPAGITVDASSTATTLILTGVATADDYETAIEALTFDNTLAAPILGTRDIAVTINDGATDGPPAIASISVKEQAVEFLVIADVPYGDNDFLVLEDVLSNVSPDMDFVVHLGDIKGGGSTVDPTIYFPQVADTLKISSQPLFIVLGDNEYNDMPDPDAALAEWMEDFLYFDQNWNHDLGVMYQEIRPENFSFVIDQTLFVGLNLVGSTVHDANEWATRSADDLVWVEDMFSQFGTAVNNAVFFAHAAPSLAGYETFEAGFIAAAQDFDKPILYLQGDTHIWSLSDPYPQAPNVTKVIVDKTGPAGPLEVSVTNDPDDPFASDHDFGGLFL